MEISILGTKYNIIKKPYYGDPEFEASSFCGYCNFFTKEIVYCDMTTYPGVTERDSPELAVLSEKETVRHEIVHAFLSESGLRDDTFTIDRPWAKNEEMVDWIAVQGPKIYDAWRAADAL